MCLRITDIIGDNVVLGQAKLIHSLSSEIFKNHMRAGGHFSYRRKEDWRTAADEIIADLNSVFSWVRCGTLTLNQLHVTHFAYH